MLSSLHHCHFLTVKLIDTDKSNDAPSLVVISWNIEGLERNIHNLDHFLSIVKPCLVLLSEPQIFACDVARAMLVSAGNYKYYMNSKDSHDPDTSLFYPPPVRLYFLFSSDCLDILLPVTLVFTCQQLA